MVGKRFDTSNYDVDRPLPTGKNKVVGVMKDESGGQIMKRFVGLHPVVGLHPFVGLKTYSYLKDNDEGKKAKGIKISAVKENLNFKIIKIVEKQVKLIISYLEKKKINIDCLEEDQRKFV